MVDYDVFLSDCPARTTIDVICGTWTVVVIAALQDEPRRYGQLREQIGGISNKMLTQTIQKLKRNGLISNTDSDNPAYVLTELGRSLLTPIQGLVEWAESNTDELLSARDASDKPHKA